MATGRPLLRFRVSTSKRGWERSREIRPRVTGPYIFSEIDRERFTPSVASDACEIPTPRREANLLVP